MNVDEATLNLGTRTETIATWTNQAYNNSNKSRPKEYNKGEVHDLLLLNLKTLTIHSVLAF